MVVHRQQVAQPPRNGQGDIGQAGHVQIGPGGVALNGLAEADGHLLAGVGGDALGHVGDEGVGEPLVDDLVDEVHGAEDFGVDNHRDALVIADFFHQGLELGVLHLGGNGLIAQQAA